MMPDAGYSAIKEEFATKRIEATNAFQEWLQRC
jgi:hypothetical protein